MESVCNVLDVYQCINHGNSDWPRILFAVLSSKWGPAQAGATCDHVICVNKQWNGAGPS
jgi:hypothetical protein